MKKTFVLVLITLFVISIAGASVIYLNNGKAEFCEFHNLENELIEVHDTENSINCALVRVTCSFCKGTGKSPGREYPPNYSGERALMKPRCPYCSEIYSHYHKPCPSCRGKGYVERVK